ncbi:MAG: SdrD B-like domain-containing protein, partial [Bacteroidota bacterium]
NVSVYRTTLPAGTSSVTYSNQTNENSAQSMVLYLFRNDSNAGENSGVFTGISGFNDIQTVNIAIPNATVFRDLELVVPVSELTEDGRYLQITATAGGVADTLILTGPTGDCCLGLFELKLPNIPPGTTNVTVEMDSRNDMCSCDPTGTLNGQSWVIASAIRTNLLCSDRPANPICYAGSDGTEALYGIDASTDGFIGGYGTATEIEAIAFDQNGTTLYGVNGNVFGTISTVTGAFSAFSNIVGSGNGVDGAVLMADIDGLSLDPFNNLMYASVRRSGEPDLLIVINQNTGQISTSAFAAGVDYVEISGTGIGADIDDIAFDPTTGNLYGIATSGSNSASSLILIDPATGSSTLIGNMNQDDVEGLGVTADGQLYATTGDSPATNANSWFTVNKTTGALTYQNTFTTGSDFESIDCRTEAVTLGSICGIVFEDTNDDLTGDIGIPNINVTLFDENDVQIASTNTVAGGGYCFNNLAPGRYTIVEKDAANYSSVIDADGGNPNEIDTVLALSQNLTGQDFVDRQFQLCEIPPTAGVNSSFLDWDEFAGAESTACTVGNNASQAVYDTLTQNPVNVVNPQTGNTTTVQLDWSGAGTCESGLIRSLNGGEAQVFNLALDGATTNDCSQLVVTFGEPVVDVYMT